MQLIIIENGNHQSPITTKYPIETTRNWSTKPNAGHIVIINQNSDGNGNGNGEGKFQQSMCVCLYE